MNLSTQIIKNKKGFTLIELLVVIGILAILLAITLIAINPARQFAQANNTKRSSDVNAILNAINQYMSDYGGAVHSEITTAVQAISNTGADLCTVLVPTYIASLPSDPTVGVPKGAVPVPCPAAYSTTYTVIQSVTDRRITVCAPNEESPATADICVTR